MSRRHALVRPRARLVLAAGVAACAFTVCGTRAAERSFADIVAQPPRATGDAGPSANAAGAPQPTSVRIDRETVTLQTPQEQLDKLPYNHYVMANAKRVKLDPALIHAVILVESNHNPLAISPKGAVGLMQLMPQTATRFGVRDARIAADNIRGGTTYLRWLVDYFKGDLQLALAAYNAGEDAVVRNGYKVPPFLETLIYVPKVLEEYRRLRGPTTVFGPQIREMPDGRWVVQVQAANR